MIYDFDNQRSSSSSSFYFFKGKSYLLFLFGELLPLSKCEQLGPHLSLCRRWPLISSN